MTEYLVLEGTLSVCYFYVALLWLMLAIMNMVRIFVCRASCKIIHTLMQNARCVVCSHLYSSFTYIMT